MKTLQKDITTPEQSKRLLELGVPADSADLLMFTYGCCHVKLLERHTYSEFIETCVGDQLKPYYHPCWSVGRLIEIMTICYKWDLLSCASFRIYVTDIIGHNLINQLINDLSLEISRGKIDFSKLEE